MRVDVSLLPVLAATFMLVFARVGAMVMLLPGLGESNIPVRIKLAIALALTQVQEQTLVFVPKILAIFVTLLLALPFMADALHSHMMRISSRIIGG